MAKVGCNLECVDDVQPNVLEFVGPVKIVLVDQSKSAYRRKICNAAMIVLAQMLMAITTITVMLFSLSYKKSTYKIALHIFLCTVGLQAFIPSGVLTLNNLNGASAPMKISDRKIEHFFMQCFGLGCAIAGAVVSHHTEYPYFYTIHCYLGLAATGLGSFCAATGLFYCGSSNDNQSPRTCMYYIHRIFGTLTVVSSSACFISGLIKTPFLKWLPSYEMYYLIMIFCVFYTIVIIYKPLKQIM